MSGTTDTDHLEHPMHPDTIDAIATAADGPADRIGMPPGGYDAHAVTEPPAVDHTADEAAAVHLENARAAVSAELARHTLSDVATDLTMMRMLREGGNLPDEKLDGALARSARTLRALAAGLVVAALAAVALVVAAPAQHAAAAEAPEPNPVTVSVVLSASTVRGAVPVTAVSATPAGFHCASVWGPTSYGRGLVGRACSRSPRFVVPVTLTARFVPPGRSTMAVTDDVDPLGTYPQVVNVIARRPSRFGTGTWIPMPQGQLYVSAPLNAWTPSVGRLTPQTYSPMQVQELVAGRWVVKATFNTGATGVASGVVYLGGGVHVVRVARQRGATVTATNGTTRTFVLPCEQDIDTV